MNPGRKGLRVLDLVKARPGHARVEAHPCEGGGVERAVGPPDVVPGSIRPVRTPSRGGEFT